MQSSLFKADWFSVIFLASCRLRDISSKTITSRLGSVLTSICSHFQDVSTQKKIKEAENPPELSRNPVTPTPTNPNPKITPDAQWRISGRAAAIATLGSPRPTSRPSASPRPVETGQLPGDALGKSVKTYGKHMENIWKTYGKHIMENHETSIDAWNRQDVFSFEPAPCNPRCQDSDPHEHATHVAQNLACRHLQLGKCCYINFLG
jgi:hypothetical protein